VSKRGGSRLRWKSVETQSKEGKEGSKQVS
jgi:hypothetical protein